MSDTTLSTVPKVERSGDLTIFTFTADAIRNVEDVIARELESLAPGSGQRYLLLDFTHVAYLNSLELGTLITLHKRVVAAGGRLVLFNLSEQVFKLFTITRLHTLLEICREVPVARPAGTPVPVPPSPPAR